MGYEILQDRLPSIISPWNILCRVLAERAKEWLWAISDIGELSEVEFDYNGIFRNMYVNLLRSGDLAAAFPRSVDNLT